MSTQTRRPPKLSVAQLWPLTVLIGIFAFLNTHPIRPHDFWWHMAAGREIVTTGRIPTVDSHSFTAAGTPYPAYQVYWLAESALYLIYTFGGSALVVFAHSLIVTGAYALTLWACYRSTHSWRVAALATCFAAALGINDWNVRPQAFTFWLVPLFLLAIQAYRERPRRCLLTVFPLGMALWVNVHGSFLIGLLTIGFWLAQELWLLLTASPTTADSRTRGHLTGAATALLSAALACLANPRGLGVVAYVHDLTSSSVVQQMVPEWAAPTFAGLHGSLFLLGLLGVTAVLALSPKRPTPCQLLSFLGFAALGLRTTRGAIWFGLAMAPVLADHAAALAARFGAIRPTMHSRGSARLNAVLAALLLLSALLTLPWLKEFLPLPPQKAILTSRETPIVATEFLLAEHPPGPIFNDVAFGSYLAWAAQPSYPVFIDPRIELYPLGLWLDYLTISAAQCDWQERLDHYAVQTLVLSSTTQQTLVEAARLSPDWAELYSDASAVILTRQSAH